jgi:GTPase SAR1 family protein
LEGTCDEYHMEIIDTTGVVQANKTFEMTIRERDGFIVVFDVNHTKTLGSIHEYLNTIRSQNFGTTRIPLLIVGNKIDLPGHESLDKKIEIELQKIIKEY